MNSSGAHTEAPTGATKAWLFLSVIALTVAAFVVRHTGVHAFLPHQGEPHERVYATQMKLLREGDPHPERTLNFGYYPLLIARVALLTESKPASGPATFEEHCAASGADIEHLRTIIALLAALAVPATYALARRFLRPMWSLLAAALYAFSPLAISFGQQARPHAAIVAPVLLAVLACLLVRRRPVLASYALAGLALGGALAILHNGIAVLPALLVAHLLRDKSRSSRAWLGLGIAVVIAAVVALLFYARGIGGVNVDPGQTSYGEQADLSGHRVFLEQFRGRGFAVIGRTLADYEPWLVSLAIAGLAVWIVRRIRARTTLASFWRGDAELVIVAAWALPYTLAIGVYDITFERFVIPLLPCLACAAAYGLAALASRLATSARASTLAAPILCVLVLAPQAYLGVRLARACGTEDTVMQCAHWIRAHVEPGSARLAVFNTIDLPLLRTDASLRDFPGQLSDVTRPWLAYQAQLAPDVLASERYELYTVPRGGRAGIALFQSDLAACIASWKADYVVIEVHTPERRAAFARVRDLLAATGTRVARFSPSNDEHDDQPFWFSHLGTAGYGWWTGHLLHARGFGPVVEVYKMR